MDTDLNREATETLRLQRRSPIRLDDAGVLNHRGTEARRLPPEPPI